MNSVKLIPSEIQFEVQAQETVLAAALRSGVSFPHSCQSGRCGACKSRLVSGEVDHLSYLPSTLPESEKNAGLILACRATPKSDIAVSWVEGLEEIQPMSVSAVVIEKIALTRDTWKISAKIEDDNFLFIPGQFAMLKIGNLPSRSYSMANQPDGKLAEFFIREVPKGLVSKAVSSTLMVGDKIQIDGPYGQSFLRRDHLGPLLAVAGGSGLAPIKSIVDGALKLGMQQKIYLYVGMRSEQDLYYQEYFESLQITFPNFRVIFALSDGSRGAPYRAGYVGDIIAEDWGTFSGDWQAYLAGPPPMVESVAAQLLQKGIHKKRIHSDPFYFSSDRTGETATDINKTKNGVAI